MKILTRDDTEHDVEYVTRADAEREIEAWKEKAETVERINTATPKESKSDKQKTGGGWIRRIVLALHRFAGRPFRNANLPTSKYATTAGEVIYGMPIWNGLKKPMSIMPMTNCQLDTAMPEDSPSYYTFRNRDGQSIQLRGDLTMEDLIRMGCTDIRLVHPGKPLAPYEWRADSISQENAKELATEPAPTNYDHGNKQ